MAGALRIEVQTGDAGSGSSPYSWWRLVAANGRTECVSEMFEGDDHRRVAKRAADRMAGRLGVPVRML